MRRILTSAERDVTAPVSQHAWRRFCHDSQHTEGGAAGNLVAREARTAACRDHVWCHRTNYQVHDDDWITMVSGMRKLVDSGNEFGKEQGPLSGWPKQDAIDPSNGSAPNTHLFVDLSLTIRLAVHSIC